MAKYTSGRQKNLKIGIASYSENLTSLEVIGNVGIATTNATSKLWVAGDGYFTGIVTAANINISSASSFAQLYVSGLSTFAGITTHTAPLFGTQASFSGVVTATTFNGQINAGVGTITTLSGTTATYGTGNFTTGNIVTGVVTTLTSTNATLTNINSAGISTLGVTSATNLTTQNINNSGITTTNSLSIGTTQVISSARQLQNIASLDATTTATIEAAIQNAPNTFTDLQVTGISTLGVTSTTNLTTQQLNVSGVGTFQSNNLKIVGASTSFQYSIAGSTIGADYTLTLPVVTSNTGIALTGVSNTFTATQTFNSTLTAVSTLTLNSSNTSNNTIATNSTTGTLVIGGTSQTGTMTLGQSTVSQTTNIQAGASGVGTTKTINFGTGGATGSFTQINVGPTAGVGTVTINSGTRLGIGSTTPTSALDIVGDAKVSGVVTATTFVGALTGTATTATKLETARNFSITGSFVTASAISFDGTGNVALAATITPDSIGLGTYTTGDYVKNISGTSNQITVTGGTGEGSTPTLSLPNNLVIPQDATVTRDLQVNRNLNVTGNITLGGTTAFINVQELKIADPDIVLGVRTDAFGNDISNDTTANHGGIAIASTEGNPLVQLFIAGIETTPATYKKIMWFKSGSFAGLNTDAWLSNYAIGIGSTQFPVGTRLAAGNVQFTQNDLAVVRNINASGVGTIPTLSGTTATYNTGNFTTGNIVTGVVTTLSGTTATYNTGNFTTGNIVTGIVTTLSGTTATYNTGNFTNGNIVTGVVTTLSGTTATYNTGNFTTGNIVTGVVTTLTSTNATLTNINSTGISTLGVTSATNLTTQNINNFGITTTNSLNIGATQVISSARQLQNISSLDATTTATIESAIQNAPNTFADLQVTGISTFTNGPVFIGSGTSTGTSSQPLQVTGGAYVSGNLGVGVTNPDAKLSVFSSGASNAIKNATNATNGYSYYILQNTGASGREYHFGLGGSTVGGVLAGSAYLYDATAGVTRWYTDSSGNFIVGSASATGTASQPLQVTGGAYVSGNLGIGITNTSNKLEVIGGNVRFSTASQGDVTITHSNLVSTIKGGTTTQVALGAGNIEAIRINTSGSVGVGTTNPTSTLHVVGNAYITGVTTSTDFDSLSDINLKTNINQIADPLEKVMQIRGVTFNWKEGNRNSAGVIAQEIEKVLPELVHGGETKTVNYNGLIGLLIECVKKQQEEIDELKRKVN